MVVVPLTVSVVLVQKVLVVAQVVTVRAVALSVRNAQVLLNQRNPIILGALDNTLMRFVRT